MRNPGADMLRLLACVVALACALMAPAAVRAQDAYPSHVVKIVIPVLPGSTTDIVARLVASQLSETWGKPVIVENMAGAAMNLGSEYVAHADPDGYTILYGTSSLAVNSSLYRTMDYDPFTDLAPVSMVAKFPFFMLCRMD